MSENSYSAQEVKAIVDLSESWKAYEHDQWKLVSFSKTKATFGWDSPYKEQYTKYVSISIEMVDFIIGVDPDALGHFFA